MAVATISVNFATLADARAGTSTVTSINPKQLRDLLNSASNMYDISVKGITTNGNLTVNGTINATAGYAGNFVASGTISGTGWDGNLSITGNVAATNGWSGNLTVTGSIFASNGYAGTLNVTGNVQATQDIVAYYSDKRLKTISGNITNALDKVNKLNGVEYNNNTVAHTFGFSDTELKIGLIAQEVKEVVPSVVKLAPFDSSNDGKSISGENYLTVQYDKLVPLLVEAIKELSEKVKLLELSKTSEK